MTVFERQLVPSNVLDRLQILSAESRIVRQKVAQSAAEIRRGLHGVVSNDPMYAISFQFSTDDGLSFSESPEILEDRNYHVRLQISQVQADPILAAFGITWVAPSGWQWVDGLPVTTYEESVSNPLTVVRVVRSPVGAQAAGFRAVVIEEFL